MTNYYIDDRATGANDGDPGGVTGPDGSGIYQDAWQSIADANAAKPFVGGDSVLFVVGSGPYRTQFPLPKNGIGGNPIRWATTATGSKVEISAGDDMNDPAYKWTPSVAGTDEYYLEAAGGGDPGLIEPLSATVNHYYRIVSAEPSRISQAPGTLDKESWGWGDADTLGYNTLYVRTAGPHPDTVDIVASQRTNIIDTNWRNHDFEDLIFSYGNTGAIHARGWNWTFRRCMFAYANLNGIYSTATDASIVIRTISCIFYWCGHRCLTLQGASTATFGMYNCTDYGAHLSMLCDSSAAPPMAMVNSINVYAEAGVFDFKKPPTLTENNNLFAPRMTAMGGDLGYISPTNWPTTDATDIPASTATDKNIVAGSLGGANYPEIRGPLITDITDEAGYINDFSVASNSPAVGAGVDWWTGLGEDQPLDYTGAAMPNPGTPTIGAVFVPGPEITVFTGKNSDGDDIASAADTVELGPSFVRMETIRVKPEP